MAAKKDEKKNRDSVTRSEHGNPKAVGKSTQRGGEELAARGKEVGRRRDRGSDAAGRPTGTSSARDSTGIDPQDPIDSKSPNLRGGG